MQPKAIQIILQPDGRITMNTNCKSRIDFYGMLVMAEKIFDANQQQQPLTGPPIEVAPEGFLDTIGIGGK